MSPANLESISVIIPTLNAGIHIENCLSALKRQDYPEERVEVLVIDGGSTDNTLEIARRYGAKIYHNPLVTTEAAKAIGIKESSNELLLFLDADNILPEKDWLAKMIRPFAYGDIVGAEPIRFVYRSGDSYINRYCALMGLNDPLCYYLGNYDKQNFISGRWTKLPVNEYKRDDYRIVECLGKTVPTFGANGFLLRKKFLERLHLKNEKYFFDNDTISTLIQDGANKFAKVDVGIIHVYSSSLKEFCKKQDRRIKDYLYFSKQGIRSPLPLPKLKVAKFCLYTLMIFPLFIDSLRGYLKKRDRAWFFHIIACLLTLVIYSKGFIISKFLRRFIFKDRADW